MERTAAEVLPDTVRHDYGGISREFRDSSGSLYFIFVLALCFIYLVLAAQFESFVDPLIIMVTVPLSMTGALLALKLTGGTLNVFSQIGLVRSDEHTSELQSLMRISYAGFCLKKQSFTNYDTPHHDRILNSYSQMTRTTHDLPI